MRGHNICCYAELTKIVPNYHQLLLIKSSVYFSVQGWGCIMYVVLTAKFNFFRFMLTLMTLVKVVMNYPKQQEMLVVDLPVG